MKNLRKYSTNFWQRVKDKGVKKPIKGDKREDSMKEAVRLSKERLLKRKNKGNR